MVWYHVSEPNSYLAVTGIGIDKVRIAKKCVVFPLQKVTKISITPFDFSMALQAMTSEKLQFSLPAVFTIGPLDEEEALQKYAVLLTGDSDGQVQTKSRTISTGRNHVQDIVRGIIEGETRSIVSNMTMEELFQQRRMFKSQVLECVQKELDQFGLRIYNANVKELQDMGESKYFESLSRKAHEGAQSQAQVDVANARMIGQIGQAEKEGETKQRIAVINATTSTKEVHRKIEQEDAEQKLKARQIEIARDLNMEQIAASRAAEQKDAELQKTVEEKRAQMQLEKLRATTVTQAKIDRESAQEKADAELYSEKADAEAVYVKKARHAEATLYARNKDAEAKERDAEAAFFVQQKEAQGLMEMSKAYGALSDVMGGPQGLMQYLMLESGTFEKLAAQNARAVNGLQPKINVWTTGNQEGGQDATAPLRNLYQSLPPLLSTVQDQTGMQPPAWLAQMPQAQGQNGEASAGEREAARQKGVV